MGKEVVVVGGGISGLSLAWYLKKYLPDISLKILDKGKKVGGVIGAYIQEPLVLDQGPKTFRYASGDALLKLIEEVGLENSLIESAAASQYRYLYYQGKLQMMPTTLQGIFSSSLTRKALPGLFKELFIKKGVYKDETIGAFARRRFGDYIADVFVDPIVLGVCGGDMHQQSIEACFPKLKEYERSYGSLIKGLFLQKNKGKRKKSLFNLRGGLFTLIESLHKQLENNIYLNEEVKEIRLCNQGLEIITSSNSYYADHLFLTLPLDAMKKIKLPSELEKSSFFEEVKSNSITSVSLAYKEAILPVKGFGYLVPSVEKQKISGVLFDSEIFPSLDDSTYQTKLTVMMGEPFCEGSDEMVIENALEALYRHLKIIKKPSVVKVFRYPGALVQYPLYHHDRLGNLQQVLKEQFPSINLAGSYLHPPGVNYCIQTSKELAKQFQEKL